MVSSLPRIADTAVHVATFYANLTNADAAALGILGGIVITPREIGNA